MDGDIASTERFHRYLNKVERIGAADSQSYEKWAMSYLFAVYAWNGSPVDGTDIIRSFAAPAMASTSGTVAQIRSDFQKKSYVIVAPSVLI